MKVFIFRETRGTAQRINMAAGKNVPTITGSRKSEELNTARHEAGGEHHREEGEPFGGDYRGDRGLEWKNWTK